jgi:hypothetical protein
VLAGAAASLGDISQDVFVIRAENSEGVAEYRATFFDGYFSPDGSYEWNLNQPVTLRSASGSVIAVLQSASVSCHEDPDVSVSFNVLAGSIDPVFTISSAQVSFPTIMHAAGRTSATVTVTDLESNGAGLFPASQPGIYTSRYNGAAPGGTTFHDSFHDPLRVVSPGGSETASDEFPGGGEYAPITGPVSSIGSRFAFVVSSGDQASGTSIFRVEAVPAPASLWILALGGLAAARRRG